MIRAIAVLFGAIVLGGCATKVDLISLQPLGDQKRSFEFFDLRPADQFITRTEREERGDRIYYGDDVVIPSRVELLADELHAALGKQLKGKAVVISTFRLQTMQYTNRGGPSYTSTGNLVADVVGAAIGRELLAATMRSNVLNAYIQIAGKIDEEEISVGTSAQVNAKNAAPELSVYVQEAITEFTKKAREALSVAPPKLGESLLEK
jgi:hypothetical protein